MWIFFLLDRCSNGPETNFLKDFNKIVWDVNMEPWNHIIDLYGMSGDWWLKELYRIKTSWIHAYFKDTPMSGLMKTSSRS